MNTILYLVCNDKAKREEKKYEIWQDIKKWKYKGTVNCTRNETKRK